MTRYLFGFLCICALGVVPLVGCSDNEGMPECQSPEDCDEGNECTEDTCTDGVCESTSVADGTVCGDDAGTCQQGTCIIRSTTWRANTTPAGSNGGPTATGGGCEVFHTGANTNLNFNVTITLDALYDASAGELTTRYTLLVTHFVFPSLSPPILSPLEYTSLSVETTITDGTPATVTNEANPAATGQLVGEFLSGDTLMLATPDEILSNTEAVTSTSSPIEVNFSGRFDLVLDRGGDRLIEVDESKCVFDEMGAAIEL